MPHVSDTGHSISGIPKSALRPGGRQFRAYSARPQKLPFGTGNIFGSEPFPFPAIAKPVGTDARRNLKTWL